MNSQEAIASLKTLCHTCKLFPKCAYKKPECFKAIETAISALQAQDSKTRKICDTCKHDPPSKKCGECLELEIDNYEPKPNEDSCINSIVEEIKELIAEIKDSGKHHANEIRLNGEMVCHGLQMALEIITEKSAERKTDEEANISR